MPLSLISYDSTGVWTKTMDSAKELVSWKNPGEVTWICVDLLENSDDIINIAEVFGIHPLTVEDILDHSQRPKIEEFDNYLFITLKAINRNTESYFHPINLIIMKDTVLTFQESPSISFEGIKKRILNNAGRIRRMGSDYLAYAVMDAVVDEYFYMVDLLGSEIEDFEDRALDEKDNVFIRDIQTFKQKLLKMRKAVWPLRESISFLKHLDSNLISAELEPFLMDLHDHIIQAAETVETHRELIAGIMEINLSVSSQRLNKVMKILTVISTIFMPLMFIGGIYGMNFENMPELGYRYSYFIVLGVMALIAIGMVVAFKIRKWI